jgi:hypothetical protein
MTTERLPAFTVEDHGPECESYGWFVGWGYVRRPGQRGYQSVEFRECLRCGYQEEVGIDDDDGDVGAV